MLPFQLETKNPSENIGCCGILRRELQGNEEFDLGYLIVKKHWGKGFAIEASKAMMDYVVRHHGVKRITAWPSKENPPSVRVVEKLGFNYERQIHQEHYGTTLENMCLYVWTTEKEG